MKQTKNALGMLISAYRAVFRAAFIKGMASAVVLTAGLAAGAAQANVYVSGDTWTSTDESSASGNIAGNVFQNENYDVTSGSITLGSGSGEISGSVINAYGVYSRNDAGAASASSGSVTINEGSNLSGAAIGGYARGSGAEAANNRVIINTALSGANDIYGGQAVVAGTGSAEAIARNNQVDLNAAYTGGQYNTILG